jgi:pimeloyl-ACP methyl ester carboxylesterase
MFARPITVVAIALALPSTAVAGTYVAIKGGPAPGPSKYDRVWVDRIGPASARHVLVLVPGTQLGAGSLVFAGRGIQAALGKSWQVWAQDRREIAFEDLKGLASGDPVTAESYYLGGKYHRMTTREAPYVREWGLNVALRDLHEVIERARAGGRKVVLGGHSLGAQEALAYAASHINGHAGYTELSGIVLIDGGAMGAFKSRIDANSLAQIKSEKAAIDHAAAFEDATGMGNLSIASSFGAIAALYARKAPDAPSALASNPLVPPSLRPPFPTTNAGFLGNIFDQTHSRAQFASFRARMGDFAPQGDPRPWVDGENVTVARFAAALSQRGHSFAESYFPRRLSLDVAAADSMKRNAVTKFVGLRLWHTKEIDLPLYAYQTDLSNGGVLRAARRVKRASKIRRLVTVDDSRNASHLDPIIAPRKTNRFIRTVVPFLRSIG